MDMNWHQALQESLNWLAIASFITFVGFTAAAILAVRYTRWGSQFWQLAGPYFSYKRSWRPLLVFALLLVLTLFSVRLNVLFSFWYNGFYSALQGLDQGAFWYLLGVFAVLASIHVLRSLCSFYVNQAFSITWRVWLTERLTRDWMHGDAYYRGQFLAEPIDNPDQRIELDVNAFVSNSLSLALGAVSALVSLVAFTGILWGLSAPLAVAGVEIPRAMVFAVYLYVVVATWIAFRLGQPLIRLNFLNEKLTANFRYALMRLRENAENVAFYQGAEVERGTLLGRFAALIVNAWALVFRNLKFSGFNLGVSQVAVVFPFILQAPRFFSGAIKLGDVMQTSQAFGQVQDALSFFRESYDEFAQYRATLDRLTGFLDANAQARVLPRVLTAEQAHALQIADLKVLRPDGHALITDLNLSLQAGQALLIKGPSGSGKTTLLRALAGLWPYAEGEVRRPLGHQALFLSQRPYLPLGDLRTVIAYPAVGQPEDQARMQQVLHQVNLGHLAERLEVSCDWAHILSVGEQQRLAFARVLFNRPQVVFLDESTSAMDEGLEHALYALLRSEMPGALLISVGHRSTLAGFHTHRLEVDGRGGWSLVAQAPALA
ncbi:MULTISPECIES: ABC transporter ATP-binding protein/permease [Pseudomonas]|jgi:putative ATP-binding cassette transporter|uniref:ABC transporter ATP-binding protein/permease n=1 Tax=Pseudomonas TaxID=286 RepID=UPI0001FB99B8|nr:MULTISPECIES: ABC transporter ATP-binding protein/permease [Pseudomonas]EGB99525.1 ABC transporter ATP-binding protein [Pseudomonas sp. TJI-51]MBA6121669.1 ABC transporter ATP-binding protein/permease [Pseudomonas juntendi]MBI6915024.1 ABC transporter ATP-binding protein/permease [Pseudomonas juntendi]MCF3155383.1 ABC transporter ATP-binding protein/permease [Pseudomonas juntendi]MCQ1993422.1 ABC transporter ATP-binding protein/permease [Pseudomonas sp. Eb3]